MNQNFMSYDARGHRYGLYILVSCIMIVVIMCHVYQLRQVSLRADAAVSAPLASRILACAQPQYVNATSFATLCGALHTLGSSIRGVQVCYDKPFHAVVQVQLARPCAIINHTQILTADAALVELEEYAQHVRDELPHIVVHEPCFARQSREACCAWIAQLPQEITERFSITWYSRSFIELVPRDALPRNVTYIVWSATRFSAELMQAMERVAQPAKKIDLRIPHYAIVIPIPRGNL